MSTETIRDGLVVIMHYTLKNDAGEVLDTSDGADPLAYLHGADNIVPGLEKELTGKAVGEKLNVSVTPEEGYGPREGELLEAPRSEFPPEAEIEVGQPVFAEGPDGQPIPFWVIEVSDEIVKLDANHPLAGETLHFDVEIVSLREPNDDEKLHGHPHGVSGTEGHGH